MRQRNINFSFEELDPVHLFFRLDVSRSEFAEMMGTSIDTIDSWCQHRRRPSTTARRLAAEIAEKLNISY
ncbi:hypothetical protein CKA32_007001 [Geitlerinema sp. FC II]|nr:hypothetical protein CKA32_007001 [Geitlerinema sp. FC II]